MQSQFQVLSEDERHQVHERTLRILADTGLRVDTARGRTLLKDAGAHVDEGAHRVRFPRNFVEDCLESAPNRFALGARRPGWDLEMNAGECTLLVDGSGVFVLDRESGARRISTFEDWLQGTKLIDSLDELGVYWTMVRPGDYESNPANLVNYWRHLFGNFSKHVQNGISEAKDAVWYLEVLQAIFGDKQTIRCKHPTSFLVCPQSPLIIEGPHTDAYLALLDYNIPLAVMPMPLMGSTAPGSLAGTIILANCEVLAMLCLLQVAAPGTPFIYAPALAVMHPRSATLAAGAIESGIMSAAGVEMARYYGLPAIGSGGGSDHHVPCIQAGYERTLGVMPTVLSWPDILVGPGLLGGSMVLSLEQLVIDVEVYNLCRRVYQGIDTRQDRWLDGVIEAVGPGGGFMAEPSTVEGIRNGEWYLTDFGWHGSYEAWEAAGRPQLLDEARDLVDSLLARHKPLPFSDEVERELKRIARRAGQQFG
jgi:trimethylamine--corrinoid protein Co-methyltransferase